MLRRHQRRPRAIVTNPQFLDHVALSQLLLSHLDPVHFGRLAHVHVFCGVGAAGELPTGSLLRILNIIVQILKIPELEDELL